MGERSWLEKPPRGEQSLPASTARGQVSEAMLRGGPLSSIRHCYTTKGDTDAASLDRYMESQAQESGRFFRSIERFDEILTRLDVRPSYHTVVQQFGGPVGGFFTFHHTFGYPSYAAYGVATDTFFDDPEFQQLFGVTLLGADGPAESVSAPIGQVMFSKTG